MSLFQTTLGAGIVFAAAQGLYMAIGPAPAPIQVHSLTYDAGYIVQDRTVAQPAVVAQWQADILTQHGNPVPNCHGEGFWRYAGGRSAPRFTLQEWVGNPNCQLLPGQYFPRAIYSNGEFEVVKRGEIFEVTE